MEEERILQNMQMEKIAGKKKNPPENSNGRQKMKNVIC